MNDPNFQYTPDCDFIQLSGNKCDKLARFKVRVWRSVDLRPSTMNLCKAHTPVMALLASTRVMKEY